MRISRLLPSFFPIIISLIKLKPTLSYALSAIVCENWQRNPYEQIPFSLKGLQGLVR